MTGNAFEGVPGSAQFRIVRFAEHVVPVQVPMSSDTIRNIEARPSAALLNSSDQAERAELQWRIATPLMCLVLALIAVPLARLRPRQGRYARIWLALLIFLLYSQLISVGKVWIARGTLPPVLGLWWTHATHRIWPTSRSFRCSPPCGLARSSRISAQAASDEHDADQRLLQLRRSAARSRSGSQRAEQRRRDGARPAPTSRFGLPAERVGGDRRRARRSARSRGR